MSMKSILRSGKLISNKPFIFFTAALSLSTMGNAFGRDAALLVNDAIPKGQPYYSKKGFTIKANGLRECMLGVDPASSTATYENGTQTIYIHYKASWGCAFKPSTQGFDVINNTGKVVAKLVWGEASWFCNMYLKKGPANFIAAVHFREYKPNRLNVTTFVQ